MHHRDLRRLGRPCTEKTSIPQTPVRPGGAELPGAQICRIIGDFARTLMTDEAFQNPRPSTPSINLQDAATKNGEQCKRIRAVPRLGFRRIRSARSLRGVETEARGARHKAQPERKPFILSGDSAGDLSGDHRTTAEGRALRSTRTENSWVRITSLKSHSAGTWFRRKGGNQTTLKAF